MYLNYQTFDYENLASKCFLCDPIVMGRLMCIPTFNIILEYYNFLMGGKELGEMMIFHLHCYSTAAMPYMGAQGGGAIVGVRLFLEFFFQVGFSSHYRGLFSMWWAFFLLVGAISRGPYLHVGAFVLLEEKWGGGGGVGRGEGVDFWNCPSLNIPLGALDTIRTFSMKLLH